MLQSSSVIAFASATDLDRARRFYERTLGLGFVEQTQVACVFDANGMMLRVTAVETPSSVGESLTSTRPSDFSPVGA